MTNRITLTAFIGLAWVAADYSSACASPSYYTVSDLGTLSGPISSAANLSGGGKVAGQSMVSSGNFHAVLWDSGPIDLGTISGDTQSLAYAVTDAAVVVGISYNYGDLQPHAFMWQAGIRTPLGNFSPRDINSGGVIVGYQTMFNAASLWVDHACTWTGGVLSDLGTLGGYNSQAMAVNSIGAIAGQAFLADNLTVRACVWISGVPHDLGTIAGVAASQSAAADVNDGGQVVGWSDAVGGQPHACLWQVNPDGTVAQRNDLGILGAGNSYATGVNNAGIIVGVSDARGFVWQAGMLADLNTRIAATGDWRIAKANAINDNGVIVAEGVRFGFTHAVKLVPSACLKADTNGDGNVDGLDVAGFLQALLGSGTATQICAGDVGSPLDSLVTPADISAFVQCLLNGGCS